MVQLGRAEKPVWFANPWGEGRLGGRGAGPPGPGEGAAGGDGGSRIQPRFGAGSGVLQPRIRGSRVRPRPRFGGAGVLQPGSTFS